MFRVVVTCDGSRTKEVVVRKHLNVGVVITLLVLAGSAATVGSAADTPRVFMNPSKIVLDGTAQTRGQIVIVVAVQGGKEHEIKVGVVENMSAKKVAQDIAKEIMLVIAASIEVKQSGEEIKLVSPKKKGGLAVSVKITNWDVVGLGVKIAKG
jgi:hypothetical protein